MNTTTESQLQFSFMNGTMATLNSYQNLSMTFNDGKNVIGKLDWNDGIMKFSGSVDESAQLFFNCIIKKHTQGTLFD